MRWKLPLVLVAAAFAPFAAQAQSVRWDPPGGQLPVGEVSQLQLAFSDCTPDDPPAPPKVDGLTLQYQGQSTNISLVNGTFSRNVTVSYAALLSRQQEVDIPAFAIKTNKGSLTVAAAHFTPAGATVGSSGIALGTVASAHLTPSSDSVWAGEVFDLKYAIDIDAGYSPTWGRGAFEWDPSPLVVEDWAQPEPFTTHDNGTRTGLGYHTRAFAPAPGHVRLNPTSQLVNLSVGVTGFGFFQQRQYQQFAVADSPASIDVKPLPPGPQAFSGAVGDFTLSSKIVPSRVKAGEPVTWTIELAGSGNWPQIRGLPPREVSSEFQVIQPKPKRTQPPGKLFEATLSEDVVLVASHAGTYAIAPVSVTYFDPRSGSYRTITAPGASVTVDPAAAPAPAGQVPAAPGAPSITTETSPSEAKVPEAPAGSLGDPVRVPSRAFALLPERWVLEACAAPFAAVALAWALLAYRRARRTDPLLQKRLARRRLGATLAALRAAPAVEAPTLLLAWQHDASLLWDIGHAAPAASSLPDAEWAALWAEADRCLYAASSALAPDWAARAQAALDRKGLDPFRLSSLLRPRNLFPLAALALTAARLHGADAADLYAAGSFGEAGKAWSAQVAADPLERSARHNLSLALAQQDRWGEAAAHACAAYVMDPTDAALRHQMALACDKAGFVPEPIEVLIQPGPVQDLARLASPGAWQRAGIAAAASTALSLVLLLLGAYRVTPRRGTLAVAGVLLVLSLAAAGASCLAHHEYGIAADPRSAIAWRTGTLRSIPTEADVAQKTTPLPAGSMGVADKTFLHWVRLRFPGGETGWVPHEELVFLWQP